MGVLRILEGGFSTTVFESIVLQDLLAASKANSYWAELLTHLKNLYNTLFLMIPHLNNLKVIINRDDNGADIGWIYSTLDLDP